MWATAGFRSWLWRQWQSSPLVVIMDAAMLSFLLASLAFLLSGG